MLNLFLIIILFPFYLWSQPEEKAIQTRISSVKLYQRSAYIKREGSILPSTIRGKVFAVLDLPVFLLDNSVIISFTQDSNLKLKTVRIVQYVEPGFKKEEAQKAQESYDALTKKINILNNQFSIISNYKAMLENLKPIKREATINSTSEIYINNKVWEGYRQMIGELLDSNSKQELELLHQIDDLNEELVVAEAKLDYYKSSEVISRKKVLIEYTGYSTNEVSFVLDYIVSGAEWYPRYSVNLDPEKNQNVLGFYAIVKNNTGEDWSNVNLTFSAADLNRDISLPQIKEKRISYQENQRMANNDSLSGVARKKSSVVSETASTRGFVQQEYKKKDMVNADKQIARDVPPKKAEEKSKNYYLKESIADKNIDGTDAEESVDSRIDDPAPVQQQSSIVITNKEKTVAKEYLKKNMLQANSIITEQNLEDMKKNYSAQIKFFKEQNYDEAITSGKLAKERISRLSIRYRKELVFAEKQIDEISLKSAMLKSNRRLGEGLIPIKKEGVGFDHQYISKNKETIISDNSFNKVYLKDWSFGSEFLYEASPLTDKAVYLMATSQKIGDDPMLEGPLDLFVKEDYLGTSVVQATSEGERLKFHLGKDDDISIERKVTTFKETKGFFSKTEHAKYIVKYVIKNSKPSRVNIVLIDRIPYTNDKKVTIEMLTKDPKLSTTEQGIYKYPITLEPNKKREMQISYEISYPEKHIPYETEKEEEP